MTKEQWKALFNSVDPDEIGRAQDALIDLSAERIEQIQEKPWPQIGDEYHYVNSYMDVAVSRLVDDKDKVLESRNYFRTAAEAEAQAMRWRAMLPKYLPEKGGEYWTLIVEGGVASTRRGNESSEMRFWLRYYTGTTFRTREDAEAWKEKYWRYFQKEKA